MLHCSARGQSDGDAGAALELLEIIMSILTHVAEGSFAGRASLANPIAKLVAYVHTVRERARAMTELSRMSDAELADIGITRSDLPRIFDRQPVR
jgi:uncharacterized protein YjiS (DUF1127 family)